METDSRLKSQLVVVEFVWFVLGEVCVLHLKPSSPHSHKPGSLNSGRPLCQWFAALQVCPSSSVCVHIGLQTSEWKGSEEQCSPIVTGTPDTVTLGGPESCRHCSQCRLCPRRALEPPSLAVKF